MTFLNLFGGAVNKLSCNYVVGGRHCLYLDYASSHVEVNGGACINGFDGAVKINTGKK